MTLVEISLTAGLAMCGIAIFLAFTRLAMGPSLADRIVAVDLIATVSVGVIAVYGIKSKQPVLLDAALVVALVGFLGTAVFARYVERKGQHG
jgi:multicomponent Na+:H+ antiporter subunit F